MAYYNPNTNTIENCRPMSWQWWHERGHQVLHSNKAWNEYWRVYHPWWIVFAVMFLTKDLKKAADVCVVAFCASVLFNEVFAWLYCIVHWREWV